MGLPQKKLAGHLHRAKWIELARPKQLPTVEDYLYFLLLAGRGFGKTRIGAEETFWKAWSKPNQLIAVVSSTGSDVRKVCFEGESGLLAVVPQECLKGG